jgi:sulfatase maturation enzyme AslB (radical SAM superfamily)
MTPPGALRAVTLVLTRACNLACRYCPRDPRRDETMSSGTLHRALDVALALAGPRLIVEFTGGEPLLAPELLREAVAWSYPPGVPRARIATPPRVACRLLTNGLLLDPATLDLLAEHDVALQISCDGPRAQDQRGPGTLAELEHVFAEIRRRRPEYWRRRVAVSAVFTPATVPDLAEAVAYFFSQEVPAIAIAPACGSAASWGTAVCAELTRQLALIFELAAVHRRRTGRAPLQHLRGGAVAAAAGPAAFACGAGRKASFVVDTDGSVHGCSYLVRARRSRLTRAALRLAAGLTYGHVADPDFAARWREPAAAASLADVLRRTERMGEGRPCVGCELDDACSACPVAGAVPGVVPDAHCLFARLAHRDSIRFQESGPLTDLLRAGGLRDDALRPVASWFASARS